MRFEGIPCFAPDLLRAVRPVDPMRSKHLGRALKQLAEEGAASIFKPHLRSSWIVGVVGALQFDVLADRIATEYNIEVRYENCSLLTARWVEGDDPKAVRAFVEDNEEAVAEDHAGCTVFLARNTWHLERTQKDYPALRFMNTRDQALADRS